MAWWIVYMQNVSKRYTPLILFHKYPGIPCITDCVMAELEKLGHRYRVALRWVKGWLRLQRKDVDLSLSEWPATRGLNVYDVRIRVLMPTIAWFNGSWHINASLSLPVIENCAVGSVKYQACHWCILWRNDMLSNVFQIKELRAEKIL